MRTIALTVNERPVTATVEPRTHLADFLREQRNLTGTHLGCEHGICGACTVLIDGSPARSCITYTVACDGARVTTVEGLDDDEIGRQLRAAFSREHALQCGYCTPGMLISARDVVTRLDAPSEHDIRVAMSGNLCRCTGYVGIIRAVQSVVAERRGAGVAAIPGAGRAMLGPVGSGHAASHANAPSITSARAVASAPEPGPAAAAVTEFKPQATFTQSFTVAHPREEVWAFFGNPQQVATCLPGASVTGASSDREVTGRMRVRIGPIAAEFEGNAEIARDPSTWSGTIMGSGGDTRSNSATRGRIEYRLTSGADPQTTRVDLTVAYAVTGMFAQFSRGGLIQDVANRLTQAFAANLEARLSGGATPQAGAAELKAGSLIYAAISGQVKSWFRRVFTRGR